MYPVSCVLADDDVMLTVRPGEHGSTFGGNPLAASVSIEALNIIKDEHLAENADAMGELFRSEMRAFASERIEEIRGKGLLNAISVRPQNRITAWDICLKMKELGLLAKPTHGHIIRFTPPLVITECQMREAIGVVRGAFGEGL
jgi:ornithine--oxo-acid transaminase